MPAPTEPNRRFTFALTAAVAATTVALGVTAATLLGWFRQNEPAKSTAPAAEPSLVYVPITPAVPVEQAAVTPAEVPAARVAVAEPHEREHEYEHDDE